MADEKRGKLTPPGLKLFRTKWKEHVVVKDFVDYYRSAETGSVERRWAHMGAGKPVPWKMLRKLCDYLNSRSKAFGLQCRLSEIAIETDELMEPLSPGEKPWYEEMWPYLLRVILEPLRRAA